MITRIFSPELSVSEQLKQLNNLRLFYLLSEVTVVAISQFYFAFNLPWQFIWPIVLSHVVFSGFFYHLSRAKAELTSPILFQSILADIAVFSGLLYFSGGATNGAVSILLLPVATAASLLNWRSSLTLAMLAIVSYSFLMFNFWPLEDNPHAHHQAQSFSNHLIAMWLAFIFSCLLLVWFIGSQAHSVREKHQKLSSMRENQLRDEQLIAIATFAANAAHDLATPLSSISLLADELKTEEGKEGVDTLIDQVQLCREIVQSISHKAIMNKSNVSLQENANDYFARVAQRWLVTRPDVELTNQIDDSLKAIEFNPDVGLESALTNILDNAADASLDNGSNQLQLFVDKNNEIIKVTIKDFGMGISQQLMQSLGNEPVASNHEGLGLGQFLANATIQRCGGNVWRQSSENGTQTVIQLALIGKLE